MLHFSVLVDQHHGIKMHDLKHKEVSLMMVHKDRNNWHSLMILLEVCCD